MKMRRSKVRRKASKRTHTQHTQTAIEFAIASTDRLQTYFWARGTRTQHTRTPTGSKRLSLLPFWFPRPPLRTRKNAWRQSTSAGVVAREMPVHEVRTNKQARIHTHAHTQKANNHSYTRQRILQSPRQTCYKNFPARASTLSGFPGPLPKTQRTSCLSTSAGVAAKNVLPRRKNNQENPTHMQKAKKHTQGKGFCSHSDRCAAKLLCVGRPHTHTQRRTQAIRASANQKTLLV